MNRDPTMNAHLIEQNTSHSLNAIITINDEKYIGEDSKHYLDFNAILNNDSMSSHNAKGILKSVSQKVANSMKSVPSLGLTNKLKPKQTFFEDIGSDCDSTNESFAQDDADPIEPESLLPQIFAYPKTMTDDNNTANDKTATTSVSSSICTTEQPENNATGVGKGIAAPQKHFVKRLVSATKKAARKYTSSGDTTINATVQKTDEETEHSDTEYDTDTVLHPEDENISDYEKKFCPGSAIILANIQRNSNRRTRTKPTPHLGIIHEKGDHITDNKKILGPIRPSYNLNINSIEKTERKHRRRNLGVEDIMCSRKSGRDNDGLNKTEGNGDDDKKKLKGRNLQQTPAETKTRFDSAGGDSASENSSKNFPHTSIKRQYLQTRKAAAQLGTTRALGEYKSKPPRPNGYCSGNTSASSFDRRYKSKPRRPNSYCSGNTSASSFDRRCKLGKMRRRDSNSSNIGRKNITIIGGKDGTSSTFHSKDTVFKKSEGSNRSERCRDLLKGTGDSFNSISTQDLQKCDRQISRHDEKIESNEVNDIDSKDKEIEKKRPLVSSNVNTTRSLQTQQSQECDRGSSRNHRRIKSDREYVSSKHSSSSRRRQHREKRSEKHKKNEIDVSGRRIKTIKKTIASLHEEMDEIKKSTRRPGTRRRSKSCTSMKNDSDIIRKEKKKSSNKSRVETKKDLTRRKLKKSTSFSMKSKKCPYKIELARLQNDTSSTSSTAS